MTLHDIDKHAIKVTLQTKIKHGSETETYELVTFGTKMYKGADLYLQYKEENETGQTQTTIKHKPDETILLRNGAIKMRQLFRLQEATNGHYESIYGRLGLRTTTKRSIINGMSRPNKGNLSLNIRYICREANPVNMR
ncbi:DUF1934 domain-containing protein [[Brevibacterium] frigoritolerans]|uniref:DUF1934 domain-containing protein n=1 Tax=Peribacillus frigoritolerans TaxID=450367 RepID=A0A941FLT4_9BACI|nr:DUF1934 domain-containing protein [Peribacillus frigoritolerans]